MYISVRVFTSYFPHLFWYTDSEVQNPFLNEGQPEKQLVWEILLVLECHSYYFSCSKRLKEKSLSTIIHSRMGLPLNVTGVE